MVRANTWDILGGVRDGPYSHVFLFFFFMLTDLYGVMGDPVTASEYYQLHNSFTKQLIDSKLP